MTIHDTDVDNLSERAASAFYKLPPASSRLIINGSFSCFHSSDDLKLIIYLSQENLSFLRLIPHHRSFPHRYQCPQQSCQNLNLKAKVSSKSQSSRTSHCSLESKSYIFLPLKFSSQWTTQSDDNSDDVAMAKLKIILCQRHLNSNQTVYAKIFSKLIFEVTRWHVTAVWPSVQQKVWA